MVKLWRDRSYERFEECFLALGGRKKKEKMVMPSSGLLLLPALCLLFFLHFQGNVTWRGAARGRGGAGGGAAWRGTWKRRDGELPILRVEENSLG